MVSWEHNYKPGLFRIISGVMTSYSKLDQLRPDLILLGNIRIIRPSIFSLARHGCINVHPGILPQIKGAFPQVWSILKDEMLGCTCHFVDKDVDAGNIILKKYIDYVPRESLEDIIAKSAKLSAILMSEVVCEFLRTGKINSKVMEKKGRYYAIPSQEKILVAKEKLQKRLYRPRET